MNKSSVKSKTKDEKSKADQDMVYKKEKYCTAPHCQEEGQDG